jgi:hypothetical protein
MAKESLSVGVPAAVPADADERVTVAADVAADAEPEVTAANGTLDKEIIGLVFKGIPLVNNIWDKNQTAIRAKNKKTGSFVNELTELLIWTAEKTGLYTVPFNINLNAVQSEPFYWTFATEVHSPDHGELVPTALIRVDTGAFRNLSDRDEGPQLLAMGLIHALVHGAQQLAFTERKRLSDKGNNEKFQYSYHDGTFVHMLKTLGLYCSPPAKRVKMDLPEHDTPIYEILKKIGVSLLSLKDKVPFITRGSKDINTENKTLGQSEDEAKAAAADAKKDKEKKAQEAAENLAIAMLAAEGIPDLSRTHVVLRCEKCGSKVVIFPGNTAPVKNECLCCGAELTPIPVA